jgi:hypothetical protein
MKIRTCILATGAILAFAAPAAYSATSSVPFDPQGGLRHVTPPTATQKLAKARLKNQSQAAMIKALRVQNKALVASNRALADANLTLYLKIGALTNPEGGDPAVNSSVLGCASKADPVQQIDYPNSFNWSC